MSIARMYTPYSAHVSGMQLLEASVRHPLNMLRLDDGMSQLQVQKRVILIIPESQSTEILICWGNELQRQYGLNKMCPKGWKWWKLWKVPLSLDAVL